jgi:hypothetical protein
MNVHENGTPYSRAALIVVAVLLSTPVVRSADKSCCSFVSVPLRVQAEGDLDKYWTLKSAELRETPSATWGYVGLQNSWYAPIESARFYGEYLDAEGRFCFSLAFSLASNEGGRNSPTRPGELRTVRSMAAAITPSVAPRELRLYLLGQTSLTGQRVLSETTPPMRVPPIISGGISESLSSITLAGELAPRGDSIGDLVFARVSVDNTGRPERVEIVRAISDKLRQWLQEYVSWSRKFIPAGRGDLPVDEDILILVRAVASRTAFEDTDFLPRLSPWVTSYLASTYEGEVMPISVVLFAPAPTRVKRLGSGEWVDLPPPPPGLFSIVSDGTAWCPDLFEYKIGLVPGQLVLEWRK